jgi:MFS family permease
VIYYLLLVVAGALWNVRDWRGWALMAAFLVSRIVGGWLSGVLLDRRGVRNSEPNTHRALRPISPVSIAIVVSLQAMYQGDPIGWIVTAVTHAIR